MQPPRPCLLMIISPHFNGRALSTVIEVLIAWILIYVYIYKYIYIYMYRFKDIDVKDLKKRHELLDWMLTGDARHALYTSGIYMYIFIDIYIHISWVMPGTLHTSGIYIYMYVFVCIYTYL
jgi:hypothetical protein